MERLVTWGAMPVLFLMTTSPSVAGTLFRCAVALPLYWGGVVSESGLYTFATEAHW